MGAAVGGGGDLHSPRLSVGWYRYSGSLYIEHAGCKALPGEAGHRAGSLGSEPGRYQQGKGDGLTDRRIKEIVYLAKKGDGPRLETALSRLAGHMEAVTRVVEANRDNPKAQEAVTELKTLLEERIAENEAAIEGATNNTGDPGILETVLQRYRQGYQGALGSGWRGSG